MDVLPEWANHFLNTILLVLLVFGVFQRRAGWWWRAMVWICAWDVVDALVDIPRASYEDNMGWAFGEVFWLAVGIVGLSIAVPQLQRRRKVEA
jgi:hypothetical protein